MYIRLISYFVVLTTVALVKAQDELPEQVTVAHRMETELSEMGGSLSIFGRDEIDLMGGLFVADILRWSPGVSLTRTGGPGQNTKMYVRGTEPRHTLLLIDGMEIRNTNSPDGFDIVNLPTGDIERIELIRGPHSPLYGADALGGVLNIVTRDAGGSLVVPPKSPWVVMGRCPGLFMPTAESKNYTTQSMAHYLIRMVFRLWRKVLRWIHMKTSQLAYQWVTIFPNPWHLNSMLA